jgi:hypothetical protein
MHEAGARLAWGEKGRGRRQPCPPPPPRPPHTLNPAALSKPPNRPPPTAHPNRPCNRQIPFDALMSPDHSFLFSLRLPDPRTAATSVAARMRHIMDQARACLSVYYLVWFVACWQLLVCLLACLLACLRAFSFGEQGWCFSLVGWFTHGLSWSGRQSVAWFTEEEVACHTADTHPAVQHGAGATGREAPLPPAPPPAHPLPTAPRPRPHAAPPARCRWRLSA